MSGSALRWGIRMSLMLFQFVTLNRLRMPTDFSASSSTALRKGMLSC